MRPIPAETALVLDVGDAVLLARRLRNTPRPAWARLSPAMLEDGARNLRAAAYSLTSLARDLEHAATVPR